MRRWLSALLLGAVLLLAGPAAQALPYTGAIVFQLGNFPALTIPGSGSGDPSLPSISADSFVGSESVPVIGIPPITQIFASVGSNGAGVVGSGPSFAGTVQIRGFGFGIPLAGFPFDGLLGFASATLPAIVGGGSTSPSAHFGRWTTGVASVFRSHTVLTAACLPGGPTCPTAMLGGATANVLYFGGAAQVVLVAPVDLYVNTGSIGGIPTFTAMALNYVPEPGAALLLAFGAVGLALAGRRARR